MSVIHLEDVKSILLDLKQEELLSLTIPDTNKKISKKAMKMFDKHNYRERLLERTIEYLDEKIKERDKLYKNK